MKRLLIMAFIALVGTSGLAAETINGVCNQIIDGPSNMGSSMLVVVAKYRRLCVELAYTKNLSAQELKDSECSSLNFPFGASPGQGYECLVARFGVLPKRSEHDLIKCKVSYHKTKEAVSAWKKDEFYVIDDNTGVDRAYTIDKSVIKVHVDKVDDITSIQWTVGTNSGLTEAFDGTRCGYGNGQIDFQIVCDPAPGF